MKPEKVRVRYAPSPTGHLHIGNARTALFNYLFARNMGGAFVIRIEDTDLKRNVADGEMSQLDNLKWLGIDWDEGPDVGGDYGPYRQSERNDLYHKYVKELLDKGLAYESYLTEEELTAMRDRQQEAGIMPHYEYEFEGMTDAQIEEVIAEKKARGLKPVIRIRLPKDHVFKFDDIVKGEIEFNSDSLGGDFIIMKEDGQPTYNFAVVVDDHLMEITHVLRGDDHIANTPKQLAIYEALDWQAPLFGHMSLIINQATGKKLSKRDETILQFIEQYRSFGYLPEAMFNFITLLGWSPVGEEEIFTKKQFIKQFDPSRLSRSPAKFDQKKLEWINNKYVKAAPLSRISHMCLLNLIANGKVEEDPDEKKIAWIRSLVALFKDQMSYTNQILELSEQFFREIPELGEGEKEELQDPSASLVLKDFYSKIKDLSPFTSVAIADVIQTVRDDTGTKGRQLYMPIRIGATRLMHGPFLTDELEVIGKEKVVTNLELTLQQIS
ncbi:glutamate--tRNA ligase [Xylocopilactobacillus apicola]|uniref:Glutamate--tRNA ligase n=1 Tax=Xylocopilactobacillus apicola TaxID=2932184 RepID=A0AAU9DG20_9LACO|nr:glutamate--tRNA ligase [Xylocopilactobacillus apicola]BDR58890.1 glutamate--tRNA ligase [Xylocopilactobacillus apicola]